MAKRTTRKTSAKGGASKSAPKRRATSTATTSKKKVTAKRTVGASSKRRSATATTASIAVAKKKVTLTRRTTRTIAAKPDATSQDPIQFPEQMQLPKTQLTAKERREFRDQLLCKRAELVGNVQGLANEAMHTEGGAPGERSAMPIHMADVGTDNWEQEFTLGLLDSEQAIVREIDDALARIADRTYGVCLATHTQISMARLRAKPWAEYCIEYARAREEGRAR